MQLIFSFVVLIATIIIHYYIIANIRGKDRYIRELESWIMKINELQIKESQKMNDYYDKIKAEQEQERAELLKENIKLKEHGL